MVVGVLFLCAVRADQGGHTASAVVPVNGVIAIPVQKNLQAYVVMCARTKQVVHIAHVLRIRLYAVYSVILPSSNKSIYFDSSSHIIEIFLLSIIL